MSAGRRAPCPARGWSRSAGGDLWLRPTLQMSCRTLPVRARKSRAVAQDPVQQVPPSERGCPPIKRQYMFMYFWAMATLRRTTQKPSGRPATVALVLATTVTALTACSSGPDTAPSSQATSPAPAVSLKDATESDQAATKACTELFGPNGSRLAQWASFPDAQPGQLTLVGRAKSSAELAIDCEVTRKSGGDERLFVKIFDDLSDYHESVESNQRDGSADESFASASNDKARTGIVIGRQAPEIAQQLNRQLPEIASRVTQ